jgi:type I restriction enzyme S subunit
MLSRFIQNQLKARASGTTVIGIQQRELRKISLAIPPFRIQRRIADILGTLDDRIEVNRRVNRTLETMAQLLFKHWFVDFGPFQNGEFVESALGLVPDGWRVEELQNLCRLTMGASPKSEFYNEDGDGLPFHQGVADFGDRFPEHRRFCTFMERLAEAGEILVSVRAPVGRINVADRRIVIGRGIAAISHTGGCNSFLLYQLKYVFREEDAIGSGTIFNAISRSDLGSIPLVVPSHEILSKFERQVKVYDQEIAVNYSQNRVLSQIRNYLLPRLLSGEIAVEAAEEAVADAG